MQEICILASFLETPVGTGLGKLTPASPGRLDHLALQFITVYTTSVSV
jgi:hypothetical protein